MNGYRVLGNTNRGEIGEEFLRRFLRHHDFEVGNGNRTDPTDLRIGATQFEVKIAPLGANGIFLFNHGQMDRQHHFLLSLGICLHHWCLKRGGMER